MSIPRSPATIGLAFATALSTAGCVQTVGPSSGMYTEGPGYNGQRTQLNQPVDCTVVTQRSGTVYGGNTQQVGPGSFTERCVSSPHSEQRKRGTDLNTQIRDAQRTVRNVQSLINTLDRF